MTAEAVTCDDFVAAMESITHAPASRPRSASVSPLVSCRRESPRLAVEIALRCGGPPLHRRTGAALRRRWASKKPHPAGRAKQHHSTSRFAMGLLDRDGRAHHATG